LLALINLTAHLLAGPYKRDCTPVFWPLQAPPVFQPKKVEKDKPRQIDLMLERLKQ